MNSADVLYFWFEEIDPKMWFGGGPEFDRTVRERFLETFGRALRGDLKDWRSTPQGRLAEIIVLDQFSRNMFRGSPEAFSGDTMARTLAKEAVAAKADKALNVQQRAFIYLPYMHSEDPADHETAMKLFALPGLEDNLRFEILHKKIIDRFGRFPHRNAALGRKSTPEEIEFLKQPGSSFG